MLLHRAGVTVDERTIAEYCGTSSGTGTNIFLLFAYLRQQLGERVDMHFREGNRPSPPYLERVRINRLINHWVMVAGEGGGSFPVWDPLAGRKNVRRTEHVYRSRHRFISLSPDY
jgi:hypothetical protein